MNRHEFKDLNRVKWFVVILVFILTQRTYSQAVYHDHYESIVSDTMLSSNEIGIKEVFYSSEKKLKRKKGKVNSVKFYKNKKLVYYKKMIGSTFEECFFSYNDKGRLSNEYKYYLSVPKSHTYYSYAENGILESTSTITDTKLYKVNFAYSNIGELLEAKLIVNDRWNYFKNFYLTENASSLTKRVSLVTDTSSNFRKIDTLAIEYIDRKQKSLVYISDSKNLKIYTVKVFGERGLLKTRSSQILEDGNSFTSEYSEYSYPDNNEIFMIEKIYYTEKKNGFNILYKVPFNSISQPDFKFPEVKKQKESSR